MEKKKASLILNLSRTEIYIFLGVGIALILLPLIFTWDLISWISFKDKGEIGDTIGGITAPFIGFGGSILVYLALKAQIDANNKIQQQFDEQKKIDYKQNFESIFFNMLNIHHDIVKNIDYNLIDLISPFSQLNTYSSREITEFNKIINIQRNLQSRDVFKHTLFALYRLIKEDLKLITEEENISKIPNQNFRVVYYIKDKIKNFEQIFPTHELKSLNQSKLTRFQSIYDFVYFKLSTDFGHYFRNLYRIIKMVDEKKFSEDAIEDYKIKYSYTSIIRAQLSDDEIGWLFFNCLSNKGSEKFKPLIEKYSLLKIINTDDETYNFYAKFYEGSAFGKTE